MDKAEIESRVRKVLAEQLAVDEAQVVPDARFAEDLNADSLDLVEAVLALEEEWNIDIPEEEMEGVKTVGQAVALVEQKLGSSRPRWANGSSSPGSDRSRRWAPAWTTSGPGSRPAATGSA
jgi:acyl carrier protein